MKNRSVPCKGRKKSSYLLVWNKVKNLVCHANTIKVSGFSHVKPVQYIITHKLRILARKIFTLRRNSEYRKRKIAQEFPHLRHHKFCSPSKNKIDVKPRIVHLDYWDISTRHRVKLSNFRVCLQDVKQALKKVLLISDIGIQAINSQKRSKKT